MSRGGLGVAVLCVGVALAGCGSSERHRPAPTARQTLVRYVTALERSDGTALCRVLAPTARGEIDEALNEILPGPLPRGCPARAVQMLARPSSRVDPAKVRLVAGPRGAFTFRIPGQLGPYELGKVGGGWRVTHFRYQPGLFRRTAGAACMQFGPTLASLPLLPTGRRALVKFLHSYSDRVGNVSYGVNTAPAPQSLFAAQRDLANRFWKLQLDVDAAQARVRHGAPIVRTIRRLSRQLARDGRRASALTRRLHIRCSPPSLDRRSAIAIKRFQARANRVCRRSLAAIEATKNADVETRLRAFLSENTKRLRTLSRIRPPAGLRALLESTLATSRREQAMLERAVARARAGDRAGSAREMSAARRTALRAESGWRRLGLDVCAEL